MVIFYFPEGGPVKGRPDFQILYLLEVRSEDAFQCRHSLHVIATRTFSKVKNSVAKGSRGAGMENA